MRDLSHRPGLIGQCFCSSSIETAATDLSVVDVLKQQATSLRRLSERLASIASIYDVSVAQREYTVTAGHQVVTAGKVNISNT